MMAAVIAAGLAGVTLTLVVYGKKKEKEVK